MANREGAPARLLTHGPSRSAEEALASVEARLLSDFAPTVPSEVIHSHVAEVAGGYAGARITAYVPVLVDRAVRRRLRVG